MGDTSWQVKQKYNKKTYKRFGCDMKISDFEKIEKFRIEQGCSRPELINMLYKFYIENHTK